ncbi:hypothetical protein C8J56DRAFT_1070769 [Mycena floridula]|nr:hypothetical protein C8J56DRAFT_1070769 [Mycena floridula]
MFQDNAMSGDADHHCTSSDEGTFEKEIESSSSSGSDTDSIHSVYQDTIASVASIHEDEVPADPLTDISARLIRGRESLWTNIAPHLSSFESSKPLNIEMVDVWCSERWARQSDQKIPLYIPYHPSHIPWAALAEFTTILDHISTVSPLMITLSRRKDHLCVVIFEVVHGSKTMVHILGANDRPEQSSRLEIKDREIVEEAWTRIQQYMGWKKSKVNWDGYLMVWNIPRVYEDCGVLAAQIVDYIMGHGLIIGSAGFWKRPIFPCTHRLRLRMLKDIHELLTEATMISTCPETTPFLASGGKQFAKITSQLVQTMTDYCVSCKSEINTRISSVSSRTFNRTIDEHQADELQTIISRTWIKAYAKTQHLTSLLPGSVPDLNIVDLCLSLEWNSRGQPQFGYLPQGCPMSATIPNEPMMSLLWDGCSYCVTVFHPHQKCIHLLGLLPEGGNQERESFPNEAAHTFWLSLFPNVMVPQPIYRIRRWKDEAADTLVASCQQLSGLSSILGTLASTHFDRLEDEKEQCLEDHTKQLGEDDVDAEESTFETELTWSNQQSKPETSFRDKILKLPWAQGARDIQSYIDGSDCGLTKAAYSRKKLSPPTILHHHIASIKWDSQKIPHDPLFDDYHNGPDLSTLSDREKVAGFNMDQVYTFQRPVEGTGDWVDWGWRLLANWFLAFRQDEPQFIKEHMTPSTVLQPPSAPSAVTDPEEQLDICHVGLKGFTDLCGDNISISLRGIVPGSPERFVVINPYLDNQSISDLNVTVDFDSLILVTSSPQFKGTVNVSWGPQVRRTSPLAKDNHISVNLLVPRSQEDAEQNGHFRTEWWTKRFRLSHIPHAQFGRIEDFALYIFFPRMAHQKKYGSRRYWRTMIPPRDLEEFYARVVRPATQGVQPDQYMVYATLDKAHSQFKSRGPNAKPKPFSPELFPLLIEKMKSIVRSHPDLARFGSMFFVLEGKGFKLRTLGVEEQGLLEQVRNRFLFTTSRASRSAKRSLDLLKTTFSCLDWPHMENRSHCELYIDVAFTYTPPAKLATPLLGVWHLPYLQSMFEEAGFRTGISHSAGSLSGYGAHQAEMLPARQEVTHIVHRVSYNQSWEVARRDDNQRDFISPSAAYNGGPEYTIPVNTAREVLYGIGPSSRQTYGIRDEWRVGFQAIGPIIESVADNMFMAVNRSRCAAAVWLPTGVFFAFIRTRMLAIQRLQTGLSCMQVPENLGEISGLLTYMLEALMYTPRRPSVHVVSALRELAAMEITKGFGIFFIHDLNESLANPIPGLPSFDSTAVLANLKIKAAKRKRPETRHAPMQTSDEYPIGKTNTARKIKQIISTEPWTLVINWIPEPLPSNVTWEVQRLFTTFTHYIWQTLSKGYKIDPDTPEPETLNEALEMWSLAKVRAVISKPDFFAVLCGLPGAGPDGGESFDLRTGYFFDESLPQRLPTGWKWWQNENSYHQQYLRLISQHDKGSIDEQLSTLLLRCQCLPRLPKTGFWQVQRGSVVIDTNPRYYRICGISDEAEQRERKKRGAQVHVTNQELATIFPPPTAVFQIGSVRDRRTTKTKSSRVPPSNRYQQQDIKGRQL